MALPPFLLLVFLAFLGSAAADAEHNSFQIINLSSLPVLSAGCVAALTNNITCSFIEVGGSLYQQTENLTTQYLDQLCTSECADSIFDYRANVLEACDNDVYNDTSNATQYQSASGGAYSPIVLPDYYFTNYRQRCTKDSSGGYCYQHLLSSNTQDECDECGLKMFRAELENGYFYNEALASDYSSLTSSCSVTNLPFTSPPSVVIASNTAASPSPTCAGRLVDIPSGSTCDAVAAANNISTWQLLSTNGLIGGCVDFPTSGALCVSGTCKTHKVEPGEDCLQLVYQFGMTITQLRTWNPNLSPDCGNFDTVVGHQICVSNPSNFTMPTNTRALSTTAPTVAASVPTDIVDGTNLNCGQYYHINEGDTCAHISVAKAISLDDFYFLNPEINSNCTNLYLNYSYCVQPVGDISSYAGYGIGAVTSGVTEVSSTKVTGTPTAFDTLPDATMATLNVEPTSGYLFALANGTRGDCEEYTDNIYGAVDCAYINPGVATTDLTSWNPSLSPYSCTLVNETRYCTILGDAYVYANYTEDTPYTPGPANAAKSSTASCYSWYSVQSGDNCSSIEAEFGINLAQFYHWNPSINQDCTGLQEVAAYCVLGEDLPEGSPPGPTQVGIASDCQDYYVVESGDGCQSIADASQITVTQLEAWNPAIGSDCKNLQPGYALCVGTKSSAITTSSKSSATATQTCATAPGPTQSGIACQCTKFVQQKDGHYCGDLASENDITLDQFYKLNPGVGDNCQFLVAGNWYCVASPSSTAPSTSKNPTSPTSSKAPTQTCAAAPGPAQTGMPCDCSRYVQQTNGKYCGDLASDAGITLDQFYKLNPAVGNSCQYLVGGDYYCVATSSATKPTSTSKAASPTCATAPGPTQTGVPCGCTKFIQQTTGKYCGDLASSASITLDQFYAWNPAVGTSCQFLAAGNYYCVAAPACVKAPGPSQSGMPCYCKQFVQQTSGKYCGDLAGDNGITLTQFYAWNPAVGDECQYLVGGDYYCVSA
ncbi:carbohydrate-binding module family 50 protein [Aureobasidium subglaciale EXF-2481]|uniref:Carbohydrate-binding module family 50 protein n=1 Tax=Aureobasidium subglaciale (strain EXF-2481) TaxID=1043005 RepID=A0A074YWS5_AURSE|nr:carbohydrate-binding module family 50 protein [Aureobasidium subglaciale EXF-2481]KEQ98602.1 carbohydrate-binding module family 50 protein [Aureobasidium subglaciale EXF-2481]